MKPRLIVSAIEHESILETARDLEREGIEVIYLPVSRAGLVDLGKLKESLNERTVLVSVMYANNEIGSIQPISEIAKIIEKFRDANKSRIHSNDANGFSRHSHELALSSRRLPLFHTDAVQALQYLDLSVSKLEADLITLSAHKIYGPKGIGALYVRQHQRITNQSRMNQFVNSGKIRYSLMKPIITGGGQEDGLRSGTENVPYIVGFAKAVELAVKVREKEAVRVKKLRDYFWLGIKRIYPPAQINADDKQINADKRLPNNLNLYFPRQNANEFLIKLDLAGVAASSGSACSSRAAEPSHVLKAIGLSDERRKSSIRFTLGRPTTRQEIDTALKVIKNLIEKKQ